MATEPVRATVSLDRIADLQENVERVIRGKSDAIRLAIAAILARGHILLEDVPGVGKTTLAHALAKSVSLDFQRIQFTSDLLPADIIGVTIFKRDSQEFEFVTGPVFTNVLLADEINRATPKTQSALLEAMNESTVTIDKEHYPLPDPFLVIATQNPIEYVGTFPLPESQLDRFLMKITLGYPSSSDEKDLLRSGGGQQALQQLTPVLGADELREIQGSVPRVHVNDSLVDYLLRIIHATREHQDVALGVSTRGALTFFRACQAYAMVMGRDYVIPDDAKKLAIPVLSHRVILRERAVRRGDFTPEARFIERVLAEVPIPR